MFDVYARTFMTAARLDHVEAPCIKIKPERRRGWFAQQRRCIDLDKL